MDEATPTQEWGTLYEVTLNRPDTEQIITERRATSARWAARDHVETRTYPGDYDRHFTVYVREAGAEGAWLEFEIEVTWEFDATIQECGEWSPPEPPPTLDGIEFEILDTESEGGRRTVTGSVFGHWGVHCTREYETPDVHLSLLPIGYRMPEMSWRIDAVVELAKFLDEKIGDPEWARVTSTDEWDGTGLDVIRHAVIDFDDEHPGQLCPWLAKSWRRALGRECDEAAAGTEGGDRG